MLRVLSISLLAKLIVPNNSRSYFELKLCNHLA